MVSSIQTMKTWLLVCINNIIHFKNIFLISSNTGIPLVISGLTSKKELLIKKMYRRLYYRIVNNLLEAVNPDKVLNVDETSFNCVRPWENLSDAEIGKLLHHSMTSQKNVSLATTSQKSQFDPTPQAII